uniref:Uncharacterized protein n=1 Tax=Anguilla anguilla TaxID=7936 RepID=A0A0E9VIJ5_ANGAN
MVITPAYLYARADARGPGHPFSWILKRVRLSTLPRGTAAVSCPRF